MDIKNHESINVLYSSLRTKEFFDLEKQRIIIFLEGTLEKQWLESILKV